METSFLMVPGEPCSLNHSTELVPLQGVKQGSEAVLWRGECVTVSCCQPPLTEMGRDAPTRRKSGWVPRGRWGGYTADP